MTLDDLTAAWGNANVRAFSRVIRQGESSQDDSAYSILFGGSHFADFRAHPFDGIPTTQGGKAAGAYQFLGTTWKGLREQYGFTDFSPVNQDLGCVALVAEKGALGDVENGRLDEAIRKCRATWTSLPGASESNPHWTLDRAKEVFQQYGGTLADGQAQPVSPPPTQEEKSMPTILALLPLVSQLVSGVGSLFAKSEVAQRNLAAVQKTADIITQATGTPNLQAAVDKMTSDPDAKAAANKAFDDAKDDIMALMEVGEGGIGSARAFAGSQYQAGGPWWRFLANGAFWITIIFTPAVYMVVYRVLWAIKQDGGSLFSEQLQTVVVTAVISGLLGSITGFWMGAAYQHIRQAAAQQTGGTA